MWVRTVEERNCSKKQRFGQHYCVKLRRKEYIENTIEGKLALMPATKTIGSGGVVPPIL